MATVNCLGSAIGVDLTGVDWIFSAPNYHVGLATSFVYQLVSSDGSSAYQYQSQTGDFSYTAGVLTAGTVVNFARYTNGLASPPNYFIFGFNVTLAQAAAVGNGHPLLELLLSSSDLVDGSFNGADILYGGTGNDSVFGLGGDDQLSVRTGMTHFTAVSATTVSTAVRATIFCPETPDLTSFLAETAMIRW